MACEGSVSGDRCCIGKQKTVWASRVVSDHMSSIMILWMVRSGEWSANEWRLLYRTVWSSQAERATMLSKP